MSCLILTFLLKFIAGLNFLLFLTKKIKSKEIYDIIHCKCEINCTKKITKYFKILKNPFLYSSLVRFLNHYLYKKGT